MDTVITEKEAAGLDGQAFTDKVRSVVERHKDKPLRAMLEMPLPAGAEFLPFKFDRRIEELRSELGKLEAKQKELDLLKPLGIEMNYVLGVRKQGRLLMAKLSKELEAHEDSKKRRERWLAVREKAAEVEAELQKKYPVRLSVEALRNLEFWRKMPLGEGPRAKTIPLPRLVVFSLEASTSHMQISPRSDGYGGVWYQWTSSTMPRFLKRAFHHFHHAVKQLGLNRDIGFEAEFTGVIPADVREKIEAARADFGKSIYIISEAPKLRLWERVTVPVGDPLVIGVYRHSLYLIADFDTTRLEQEYLFTLPKEGASPIRGDNGRGPGR